MAAEWSATPIIDWLLRRGRRIRDPEELLGAVCGQVVAAGMPLERVAVFIRTLHPQYFGHAFGWENGKTETFYGGHDTLASDDFQLSPIRRIIAGERVIRRRLGERGSPLDYPVLRELVAEGFTDYVMAELVFSNDARNGVSLATRAVGGFSEYDIQEVQRLLHPFALIMENHTNRGIAANLLDAYLGSLSGARVLDGKIRRGDGDEIDAVIWFSDLRNSTRLAEELGHRKFLELLNDYFEATAGAVLEHGGEVLRFIGDASLAVFPVGAEANPAPVCRAAISAARAAAQRVSAANERRRSGGDPAFAYGVGLHLGKVLYGNIGTTRRLEFSVIGPAANETARIEGLCKLIGEPVIVSESVVGHLARDDAGGGWRTLGRHALRGVGREIEVYGLPSAA